MVGRRLGLLLSAALTAACSTQEPDPEPAPQHETSAVVARLAQQARERWEPEGLGIDWIQTVLAWGFLRAHAADPAAGHDAFGVTWMEGHLADFEGADPRTFNSSDSMSPASVAASLMADGPTLPLTPITDAAFAYLAAVPLTGDGAYPHWGPDHPVFGGTRQIWVDSQFMIGMTLLQEHRRTGDAALLDAWVTQYRLTSERCRVEADQLYLHAWDDVDGVNVPAEPIYWARGNSWVLISAAEFLRLAPTHLERAAIEALFLDHLEASVATQRDDGRFWTVMNAPFGDDGRNYPETSATALIGYAIAVGLDAGVLDADPWATHLGAIVAAVADQLWEEDGRLILQGTSFGTNPGDYDNYVNTATLPDQIVGVGATLMLLAEVDGLPDPTLGPYAELP